MKKKKMTKQTADRLASLFGAIAGTGALLHGLNVPLGHLGAADGSTVIATIALALLGFVTNKGAHPSELPEGDIQ